MPTRFDLAPHTQPSQASQSMIPKPDDPTRMRAAVKAFSSFCRYNSELRGADEKNALTTFHCVAEPPIALPDYIDRLDRHTKCGEEAVLIALVLLGRYCRAARMLPSVLSAHRLMLVAIRVAVKSHHDVFRSNKTYASAGGLRLTEFNQLEFIMVCRIEFKVLVKNEELEYTRAAVNSAIEIIDACGGDIATIGGREWLDIATHVADAMQPRVATVPVMSDKEASVAVRYEASTASNTSSTPSTSETQVPKPMFLRGSPAGAASRSRFKSPSNSEVESRYAPSEGLDAPPPDGSPRTSAGSDPQPTMGCNDASPTAKPATKDGDDDIAGGGGIVPRPPPTVSGSAMQAVSALRRTGPSAPRAPSQE